jgi:nucleotide-binding universal stress UspA family protein
MFKHILLLYAGSPLTQGVLHHTIAFAHSFEAQVTLLCLLDNPHPGTLVDTFDWQLRKQTVEAHLDSIAGRLQAAGVASRTIKIVGCSTSSVISYIRSQQVDLVIFSTDGESKSAGENFAEVVQNILLRTHIAGLRVRAEQTHQTSLGAQRLLMPFAQTLRAAEGLPFVTTLARVYGPQLWLLHLLCKPQLPRQATCSSEDKAPAERRMIQQRAELEAQLLNASEHQLLESNDLAACLHDLAEAAGIDLEILSAYQYSAGRQWPDGRVITNLVAYGATPLLVVQTLSLGWRSTLTAGTAHEATGHLSIAGEQLSATWLYD